MSKFLNMASAFVFLMFFVAPVAGVTLYQLLMATDRYESKAVTVISEQKSGASALDLTFLGLPSFGSDRDAHIIIEFILSRDMMNYLQRQIDIRSHYSGSDVDYISRLASDATGEEFHELYQDYFTADYDTEKKMITLAVQAFDRNYAQDALRLILRRADEFIDALNNKVSREQLRFFETEVVSREQELKKLKAELLEFQQTNKVLSTEAEAKTIFTTIGALETLLAQKNSELDSRKKILSKDSAILQELRAQISSLSRQIETEKARLAGGGGRDISKLQAEFNEIRLGLELATAAYKSTLSTLEQVRVEASRKLKFLIVVTQPSLADESEYPRTLYIIISTILISLMIYVVMSLIVAIIREHG
ncbi:MAG: hypothetical protein AAF441_07405 [Pseudomonadota bacterium]